MSTIDTDTLRNLEYGAVREKIAACAVSSMGSNSVKKTTPFTNITDVERELALASEMMRAVDDGFPLGPIKDIRPLLKRAAIEGAVSEPSALVELTATLETVLLVRSWFDNGDDGDDDDYGKLIDLISPLEPCDELRVNILRIIDLGTGEVRDGASSLLSRLRREIEQGINSIRASAESALSKLSDDVLTERLVRVRGNSFVLAVRAIRQSAVLGVIHDQSASGQTVFIEPVACLEAGNSVRSLQIKERREIERLLRELTDHVRRDIPKLEDNLSTLTIVDTLYAIAQYARSVDATVPKVTEAGLLEICAGRHPLLISRTGDETSVVPLWVRFDYDLSLVVISGPNAGGKTVAIKTTGLLLLMAQSGWPVPASEGTTLPVFFQIFAEIGDQQSIEDDLSTFSSRMSALARISNMADDRTLILVDEIGSGTDPDQGAALAASMFEAWHSSRARAVVTTHLGALKIFAHDTPWAANGSLEFDGKTLSPTFRYVHGLPGSSYALEIAKRVGLGQGVLERARELLGDERVTTESLIADLSFKLEEAERKSRELEAREQKLFASEDVYEAKMDGLKGEEARKRREASEKAVRILDDARSLIEKTVAEVRSSGAGKDDIRAARSAIASARSQAQDMSKESSVPKKKKAQERKFAEGDWVRIAGLKAEGEIVAVDIGKGRGSVQTAGARMDVDLSDLTLSSRPGAKKKATTLYIASDDARMDLDMRGMTFDEAWPVLERFLDDAFLAGLRNVRIIHGKGTGALRQKIVAELGNHPHAKGFHQAGWDEGGAGVTIVDLKT